MRIAIIALLAISLAGCATAYQPQGATGGFSSTQLDTNVFTVTFKGNGYTDKERASDFALLRSAEITLEKGFKYFAIIDGQSYTKESSYTTPTTATTNVYGSSYGSTYSGSAYTTVSGGQTVRISKPRQSNTIVCFSEKPDGFSYNAEFIVKSLKEKYRLNAPNNSLQADRP